MTEEIKGVFALLENRKETIMGMRTYYSGIINGIECVVVFSRWGKVAAATTVTSLITHFGVTEIIFTGVAGAISSELQIGDIVLGKRLMQHDMDSRPLIHQYEVPLHKKIFFDSSGQLLKLTTDSINELREEGKFRTKDFEKFHIENPKLFTGDIASGDQFFSRHEQKEKLHASLPSILCVEMEGAAVAQICYEYHIPWIVIRTISDTSDENSPSDFQAFIEKIASYYSTEIIKRLFSKFL